MIFAIVVLAFLACLCSFRWLSSIKGERNGSQPQVIHTYFPLLGHVIGMVLHGKNYYKYLRDQCQLPIVTLPVAGFKIYAVFSVKIIQSIQKQHKTLAFQPIQAKFSVWLCGASQDAYKILQKDMNTETGEYGNIYSSMHAALNPGAILNTMNLVSARRVSASIEEIQPGTSLKLDSWLRHQVTRATTDTVYGPYNPFQDTRVENAFWEFERAIPSLLSLPSWLARTGSYNRKIVSDAFRNYFTNGYHNHASPLVKDFHAAECAYGFSLSDRSCFEVGVSLAMLANTYAAVFWVLFYVFSNTDVLQEIRYEVSTITSASTNSVNGEDVTRYVLDMTKTNSNCPLLVSTFREVIRLHSVGISLRHVCQDTVVSGGYRLKKGNTVMIPTIAIHTDPRIWGADVLTFKHDRFLLSNRTPSALKEKASPVGFRGFGGGTTLCPGRHLATTQIMVWVCMLVMRFDIEPTSGAWTKPTTERSNVANVVMRPDKEIEVKFNALQGYKAGMWDVKIVNSETTSTVTVTVEDWAED